VSSFRSSLRAWLRRYLVALGLTFLLMVSSIVIVNIYIDNEISAIRRVPNLNVASSPGQAGNFLLIGSDSRAFVESEQQAQAFGNRAQQTGQRSDTMIIVHVDPDQKKSLLVSFPRDLWVDIPGQGMSKINAAFNSGPQKVIDTFKANFQIEIHHYVEIDFASFPGIVDAIGTVPVYFPAPARDDFTGLITFAAGCYHLDGATALKYVRSRSLQYFEDGKWTNASPRADLDRIARQQNFMRRLATVGYHKATSNPLRAKTIADRVVAKLKADTQLNREDVFNLVNTFRTVDPANPNGLEMITLPVVGDTIRGGGSIVRLDQPDADQVLARLRQFGPPPGAPKPLLPTEVHVRVLNGSGQGGLAGSTLMTLQDQYGFAPAGTGNDGKVSVTQVRYVPQAAAKAKLVQSYLGGVGVFVADPQIVDADVVVVLGRDFKRIVAPAGVTPGPVGGPTSSTSAGKGGTPPSSAPPDPEAACK
jgi:polyisoprenyl-teichoic acid--peptidoglycan teichoic acid transferase